MYYGNSYYESTGPINNETDLLSLLNDSRYQEHLTDGFNTVRTDHYIDTLTTDIFLRGIEYAFWEQEKR